MVESFRIENAPLPTEAKPVKVNVGGKAVAVFRVGEALYAIDAHCTHVGGPLDQGSVSGLQVTCPLHGSIFDLTTGSVVRGPAVRPVTAYRARTEGTALVLERD